MGETFRPDPHTGAGQFAVPIATAEGRDGFGPTLNLQYSSGSGNGPFGLGWQLGVPTITRKTDKGLPTYTDRDVYVVAGMEDLVAALDSRGEAIVSDRHGFRVTRYRPRIEGAHSRIERWVAADGDVHWRVTSRDNVTQVYGRTPSARTVDPDDPRRVHTWWLQERFDDKGNHVLYEYVQEPSDLRLSGLAEQNRRYVTPCLRRILHGNTSERLDPAKRVGQVRTGVDPRDPSRQVSRHYVFETLFDYGDLPDLPSVPHDWTRTAETTTSASWPVRPDAFSSYRSGFELRTVRRCRRVLVLHHFAEGEVQDAPLVHSTDFTYSVDPDTQLSLLTEATTVGYRRAGPTYLTDRMPPVTFGYSTFEPGEQRYQSVTGADLPPRSLADPDVTFADLFGDGLPDVLQTDAYGYRFWRNQGNAALGRRRTQPTQPAGVALSDEGVALGDLGGDGLLDIIVRKEDQALFYEATPDGSWRAPRPLKSVPTVRFDDPNLRMVDLTGDGLSDIVITRDDHALWYQSLGEDGYAEARMVSHGDGAFPPLVFSDPRVRLADLTGDGLSDLVLVDDGRVEYWPNLGYGRFGARRVMSGVPRIGEGFDPARLFLIDLQGSGPSDLVYVEDQRIRFWFNRSGNDFGAPQVIRGTPPATGATVRVVDLFGTGTACIVWSFDAGTVAEGPLKVLDVCGGRKPHLLIEMRNNLGAFTRIEYAPSTRYYLEDLRRGRPWRTSLPVPVQVVARTEFVDAVHRTRSISTYRYHHGYYDGAEREFRGFGRVDRLDAEFFSETGSSFSDPVLGDLVVPDATMFAAPVLTRQWFHHGVYFDPEREVDHRSLLESYAEEFYTGDPKARAPLPPRFEDATGRETAPADLRLAHRALKGAPMRVEVYGLDGARTEEAPGHPYAVTETRYVVREVQPVGLAGQDPVFQPHDIDKIEYTYDRQPNDPRISHALVLERDGFGQTLQSVAVAYGRRTPDPALELRDQLVQARAHLTYSHTRLTNAVDTDVAYRLPVSCETVVYELTGFAVASADGYFSPSDFVRDDGAGPTLVFDRDRLPTDVEGGGRERRLLQHARTFFRPDDLGVSVGDPLALLPLGALESRALPGDTHQLALTPDIVDQVYVASNKLTVAEAEQWLTGEGGYLHSQGHPGWWVGANRTFYSANTTDDAATELAEAEAHFFRARRSRDPFHTVARSTESTQRYDDYDLLVVEARDPLGNVTTVQTEDDQGVVAVRLDYRVLQPFWTTDPNGNRRRVVFDTLGRVVGTAEMGKPGQAVGDSLVGFVADLSDVDRERFFDAPDPHSVAPDLLGDASSRMVYDAHRFFRTWQAAPDDPSQWQPVYSAAIARETHAADLAPGTRVETSVAFEYYDGAGRSAQNKIRAAPGAVDGTGTANPRWIGSGWTLFDNKGQAVRKYEPFFSRQPVRGHRFEFAATYGVSPTVLRDPIGRVVATLRPDHTWTKVVAGPWRQTTWDANDTVAIADPTADPDVGSLLARLPRDQVLPTWAQLRTDPAHATAFEALVPDPTDRANAREAVDRTLPHASTPLVIHADSLGRTFLTVHHNRWRHSDASASDPASETWHAERQRLDVEGRALGHEDADGRIVSQYRYDLLGRLLQTSSMEAGSRWILLDVQGEELVGFDDRGHRLRTTYDASRRPVDVLLRVGQGLERVVDRMVYGESRADAVARNLRGRLVERRDQAGVVSTEGFDFKGQPTQIRRRLVQTYRDLIDWSGPVVLEPETYANQTRFDALNRPWQLVTPHVEGSGSLDVVQLVYDEAGAVSQVHVWWQQTSVPSGPLDPATASQVVLGHVTYNARGQELEVAYGNGVTTTMTYDPLTHRTTSMRTRRDPSAFPGDCPVPPLAGWPGCDLQRMHYTYDAVGHVTHARDDAQQTIHFANTRVEPSASYRYDALYRLIEATGREHLGQAGGARTPHSYDDGPRSRLLHPSDGSAMGRYRERYIYDLVGNLLEMQHRNGSQLSWNRRFTYAETSALEAERTSNRLTSSTVGAATETYSTGGDGYDAHGNQLRMPQLQTLQWDFRNQLRMTQRQAVNATDTDGIAHAGERTWYVYDSSGARIRKVTEAGNGQILHERIYLGTTELFRRYGANPLTRRTVNVDQAGAVTVRIELRLAGSEPGVPDAFVRFRLPDTLDSDGARTR